MPDAPAATVHGRRRALLLVSIAVVAVLITALATIVRQPPMHGTGDADEHACPEGYSQLRVGADPDAPGGEGVAEGEDADDPDADEGTGPCWKDGAPLPEQLAELASLNSTQAAMWGFGSPGSMTAAERQNALLARAQVPHSRGTWHRVSSGILDETDPDYVAGGYGNTQLAGRMTGYAMGQHGTIYAGVANGGVWKSTDKGRHWNDIGLRLPSQIVGAIGWTSAGGSRGTLMALTGDNSFGQYNWSGSGLFYSTNEGRRWHRARGIPGGLLAFKVTVAPDRARTVYAATGSGLYRSTNAGRRFTNVKLPTVKGCSEPKRFFIEKCALSSVVTDVIVRGKDNFGHQGGAVVAAVGWRAGNQKNPDGTRQAPANGIYESASGKPRTYKLLPDSSGFAPANQVGRVSFGNAYGPQQNHNYLYALVQDAKLLQDGGVEAIPDQLSNDVISNTIVTYVNGAYVSDDFGKTWTLMEGTDGFLSPTTGSSLAPLIPLGLAPGIQAWYNNWIQPDPYTQIGGVPTNVMLGLEEIYQTATSGIPQIGPTDFQVVAPYAGGTFACVLAGKPCSLTLGLSNATSAHPDQHGVLFLPPSGSPRRALFTSDGGNYGADVPAVGPFKQTDFEAQQDGFNTLIPYAFDVSGDGTVVDGMQDNGSLIWHPGDRVAKETYPGDGGTTLIDARNSDNLIVSLAIGASLYKNTMGGKGTSVLLDDETSTVTPDVGTRYSYGALARDLAHPTRIMYGGRQIAIADARIADLTQGSWKTVYDLGTRKHPGDKKARASLNDPELQDSANDIYNKVAYVGYCGTCQTITGTTTIGTGGRTFDSGIATNYGGKWHIATAKGLPHRLINAVHVDHHHQNVVFVGLGVSTKRQAFHPGVTGHDGVSRNGGYLYVSTNGGRTFHNLTGNLPRVGVLSLAEYHRQLLVGSTLGAYIGAPLNLESHHLGEPAKYARLGGRLPAVAVTQLTFRPGHRRQLYVATFGRGLYRIALR